VVIEQQNTARCEMVVYSLQCATSVVAASGHLECAAGDNGLVHARELHLVHRLLVQARVHIHLLALGAA
jgi:hypothetical protein